MDQPLEPIEQTTPTTPIMPTEPPMPTVPPPAKKRNAFKWIVAAIFALLLLGSAAAVTAATYLLPSSDPFVRQVTSVVPYPIALVNWQPIAFKDFFIEKDAISKFFASQGGDTSSMPDPETEQTQILDTLVEKAVVQQLAKKYNLTLDQAKVDDLLNQTYEQSGSEDEFLKQVQDTFGWDKETFTERVVNPVVLAGQVREAIQADPSEQSEARSQIDAIAARLKNGEDFGALAAEASQDSSSATNGDIGFQTAANIPPAWVTAADALDKNTPSDVIELPSAFTIIEVTDKTGTDADTQYKLSIIVIFKRDMQAVIDDYTANTKVWRFLKT